MSTKGKPAQMTREEFAALVHDLHPHLRERARMLTDVAMHIIRPGDGSAKDDPEANTVVFDWLAELCATLQDTGTMLRQLRDASQIRGRTKTNEEAQKQLNGFGLRKKP